MNSEIARQRRRISQQQQGIYIRTITRVESNTELGYNRPAQATTNYFGCGMLHPVGEQQMPSQTIHLPEELYKYILATKGEDQSTSGRITELVKRGKEMEDHNER